jgi:hypothetical protein
MSLGNENWVFPESQLKQTGGAVAHGRSTARGVVWLVAAMLFLLAATNGRPAWWSSGVFAVVLVPLIILSNDMRSIVEAWSQSNRIMTIALCAFLATNIMSALANPAIETFEAVVFRSLIPLSIYLSVVGLNLRRVDLVLLVTALAMGSAVVFIRGLIAYYQEWGVPDLETLMWARYNIQRMQEYSDATFGNVSHMGSYVALLVPTFIYAALAIFTSLAGRLLMMVIATLGIANLLVSGSRTGIIILFLAILVIAFKLVTGRALARSIAIGSIIAVSAPIWVPDIVDDSFQRRYLAFLGGPGADTSTDERFNSMQIGWETFLKYPVFGIGPDMSSYHNFYGVPHQSLLHQFSELGLIGGIIFSWLNLIVLTAVIRSTRRATRDQDATIRFLWLIGPAAWLAFGLVGGITFNTSFALVWIGIANTMLGLSTMKMIPDEVTR